MPNLASAAKRDRQSKRDRARNHARRSMLKKSTKKFMDAVIHGDPSAAKEMMPELVKRIDQTAAKGTLHRNAAARKKSRLAKRLNAATAAAGKKS